MVNPHSGFRPAFLAGVALVAFSWQVRAQSGVIRRVEIAAPSLRGNLLGDSARRHVSIYLPARYYSHPHQRFPVIYLLHGFAADDRAFIRGGYQDFNVRVSMDSLIAAGKVRPMIVVTPNARNRLDGSFYANSIATGRWEDFIARDLVGYIDRNFRTVATASGRGLAGHSMGGYGALHVGARNSRVFSAIYALSPCCLGTELADTTGRSAAWRRAVSVKDTAQIRSAGFIANLLMALSAVYSPARERPPLYIEYPFTLKGDTLVRDSSVVARWRPPVQTVGRYRANLHRLVIGFDAGNADSFTDIPANVGALDAQLTSFGIQHFAEIYDGGHGNRIRERLERVVLPFFSRHFAFR